jgi:hypothetical protein
MWPGTRRGCCARFVVRASAARPRPAKLSGTEATAVATPRARFARNGAPRHSCPRSRTGTSLKKKCEPAFGRWRAGLVSFASDSISNRAARTTDRSAAAAAAPARSGILPPANGPARQHCRRDRHALDGQGIEGQGGGEVYGEHAPWLRFGLGRDEEAVAPAGKPGSTQTHGATGNRARTRANSFARVCVASIGG